MNVNSNMGAENAGPQMGGIIIDTQRMSAARRHAFVSNRRQLFRQKYTLKQGPDVLGTWRAFSWVIEGMNNGSSWEELHRRSTQDLNGVSTAKARSSAAGMTSLFDT